MELLVSTAIAGRPTTFSASIQDRAWQTSELEQEMTLESQDQDDQEVNFEENPENNGENPENNGDEPGQGSGNHADGPKLLGADLEAYELLRNLQGQDVQEKATDATGCTGNAEQEGQEEAADGSDGEESELPNMDAACMKAFLKGDDGAASIPMMPMPLSKSHHTLAEVLAEECKHGNLRNIDPLWDRLWSLLRYLRCAPDGCDRDFIPNPGRSRNMDASKLNWYQLAKHEERRLRSLQCTKIGPK